MKKVGIIGGLGPETTAKFYLEIIESVKKDKPFQRPEILIDSVKMDLKVEESFINGNDQSSAYLELLTSAAKSLEKAGADFLVIPCNTVHIFIEEIRAAVNIPVLSIIEEVTNFLVESSIKKIGLLATNNTLKTGLYGKTLELHSIKIFHPSKENQEKIGHLITRLVNGEHTQEDKTQLTKIINSLKENKVEAILLACTDLQLIISEHNSIPIFDTMKILAKATSKKISS